MKDTFKKWEKEKSLLVWKNNKTMPNPSLAVEFKTQYGFPVEMFVEFVNEKMKNPLEKLYWITRAYDEAKNTQERFKIFNT